MSVLSLHGILFITCQSGERQPGGKKTLVSRLSKVFLGTESFGLVVVHQSSPFLPCKECVCVVQCICLCMQTFCTELL